MSSAGPNLDLLTEPVDVSAMRYDPLRFCRIKRNSRHCYYTRRKKDYQVFPEDGQPQVSTIVYLSGPLPERYARMEMVSPGSTLLVTQVLPPITASWPIFVFPPSTVAPE